MYADGPCSLGVLAGSGVNLRILQLRTLRDFDVWAIDPYPNPNPPMDGAAHLPVYVPPKFPGPDIRNEAEKGELELYTGNCHCGAVIVAVKSKPISEIHVNEDDCSICIRVCLFRLLSLHVRPLSTLQHLWFGYMHIPASASQLLQSTAPVVEAYTLVTFALHLPHRNRFPLSS